ncbi:MAG TPA: hypothetical protein VGF08_05765, partial [Terriglobales bacterium]
NVAPVGAIEVHLDKGSDPRSIQVTSDEQKTIPYTIQNDHLRFFSDSTGNVRVHAANRELVYSLTLPEVGDAVWEIPARVRRGVPRSVQPEASVTELWPWLALAGAMGLAAEWMLFGRGRREARLFRRPQRLRERVFRQRAS